jgi:hypothetical protein
MMRDKSRGRGILTVDKFSSEGIYLGQAKAENLWVTSGIDEIFLLIAGLGGAPWNAADALIGVGDDGTAATDAQTDLLATVNKAYVGMDATYPQPGAAKTMLWRASFGSAVGNFAWEEFTLKNNVTGICVNRGVQSLGVKVAGAVWIATLALSLN